MANVFFVSLVGLGFGYALARLTDRTWTVPSSDDPTTATRESLPLIAVGLAVAFCLQYQRAGLSLDFFKTSLFSASMFVVERVNRRTLLVPNVITIPGAIVGLVLSTLTPPGAESALVGMIGGGAAMFVLAEAIFRVTGTEGLGMGLVKLQALIGAFLGWKLAVVSLVLASVAGAIGSYLYAAIAREDPRTLSVPFGSYMAMSAVLATTYGQTMLNWYLTLIRQ